MGNDDQILTLSELRRGGGRLAVRRGRTVVERAPGLFDSLPSGSPLPAASFPPDSAAEDEALERPIRSEDAEKAVAVVHESVTEIQAFAVSAGPQRSWDADSSAGDRAPTAFSREVGPPVPSPEPRVWSVAQLVRQVRGLVERSYGELWVEGEISNWRPSGSGHCYFTLKDGGAQLAVVMFRKQFSLVRFRPKDGDAIRVRGQLSIYESRGQMQMIAEWMEQVGLGAQLAAVRELKERLRREGLFDRKRSLPPFPKCIGVVTSAHGAALRDIVKVCRRRHAAVKLLVYPAAVQGPRCAVEVADGVRWFSRHPERADVVLVARGGGSWEDLHGFDDERVARAIAACSIPVIAGIGHATDSTIADAAADVCAPTPSAAAELLTAAQHGVEERVERLNARLSRAARYEALRARQRWSALSAEVTPRRLHDALLQREQRLDEAGFRVEAAAARILRGQGDRLARLEARLRRQSVEARMAENRRQLGVLDLRLRAARETAARRREARLEGLGARLDALNPLRVLERGYALVYGPDGRLVRSADEVGEGAQIVARLADGRLRATVNRDA
jgi:exodeoxyribonuclease VII large subunit